LVKGRDQPFDHHDTNTLKLVETPTLNSSAATLNHGAKQTSSPLFSAQLPAQAHDSADPSHGCSE
jgi:hypothetical protein